MPGVQGRARSSARVVHARRPLAGVCAHVCARVAHRALAGAGTAFLACSSPSRSRANRRRRPIRRRRPQSRRSASGPTRRSSSPVRRRIACRASPRRRRVLPHGCALLVASYNSVQHGWLRHFATGPVLALVLDAAELTRLLLRVGVHCRVVMACRVSPLQKAKARGATLQHFHWVATRLLCCNTCVAACCILMARRRRRAPRPQTGARRPSHARAWTLRGLRRSLRRSLRPRSLGLRWV